MQKMAPRSSWRIALGILGYFFATTFILGVGIVIRCGGLPDEWQMMAVVGLVSLTVILGLLCTTIRRDRPTHYNHYCIRVGEDHSENVEDIGPGEQKCGQLTIIFILTAWVIYADTWFCLLEKLATKINLFH